MAPMRRKGYSAVSLKNAKKQRLMRGSGSRYNKRRKSKSMDSSSLKSIVNKLVSNQLHVYQYPFSTRTKYPKIPDGKVNDSVGLNFSFSQMVTFDPTRDLYILLYPSHTTCVCVFQQSGPGLTPAILAYGKFIQHLIPRQSINNDNFYLSYDQAGFDSFRYVSCGLRITADDGPFNNGGKWEAVRIPFNTKGRHYNFAYNMAHPDWNTVLPNQSYMTHLIAFELNKNPHYQTGVIKTIDDFEFRLHAQNIEHEFTKIPDLVEGKISELSILNQNFQENLQDGKDRLNLFSYIYEKNFDSILVKLNSQGLTKNITFCVTANIELTPTFRGQFSHFSTESLKASDKFHKLKHRLMKDNKYPGIYNYNKRYQKAM